MKADKHLLILIGGHFANAPRPQKEARAAREAGFRVSIRGMWHDDALAVEDDEIARSLDVDFRPLLDMRKKNLRSLLARISGKRSRAWLRLTGRASAESFGLTARMMLREAKRLRPDLVMVHSEAGLWAGRKLLAEGYRVGVDFEDWFSEDLPASNRSSRPVGALKKLEHSLLHHAHAAFTTTGALARKLAAEANCTRMPETIPNAFPIPDELSELHSTLHRKDFREGPVKFYWFSQTIGPGRGLELLADALAKVSGEWELHLRGNLRGYRDWFENTFSMLEAGRIVHHLPVKNRDLPFANAFYDVGLALETPDYPNHDLTASNKIFEYMRSGLAVIATGTAGQTEVMRACPNAGWIVSPLDPDELSSALQTCIDCPDKVVLAGQAAGEAAGTVWSWDRFSPRLKDALLRAVS